MYDKPRKRKGDRSALRMTDVLGHGIYSISEAARYTGIHQRTLYWWFHDSKRSVFLSDYAEDVELEAISFYDLIDSIVVADLRHLRVSMQHIRKVKLIFSERFQTPHPFCHHGFFVDVSKRRILDTIRSSDGGKILVDAITGQGEIEKVIESHLREIDYSDATRLARLWRICKGIEIDPEIRFGKPVITGTNLTTRIIAMQYFAYDSDARIVSKIHSIKQADVLNAVSFEESKGTVKRAA